MIEAAVDHLFVFQGSKKLKIITVLQAIADYTNDEPQSIHFRRVVRKTLANRGIYQLKQEHQSVYVNINFQFIH